MANKRKIPYGVINRTKIVRECLFEDKTTYIRELELALCFHDLADRGKCVT